MGYYRCPLRQEIIHHVRLFFEQQKKKIYIFFQYFYFYSPENLFVVLNATNMKLPDAPKIGVDKIFAADYDT